MRYFAATLIVLLSTLISRADSISVQLLTIGQGEVFFQLHGHAALRLICQDSDSVYSFETDPERSAVMQYLAGNSGSIIALPSRQLIDSIGASGRGLKAYTLGLTSAEAYRLLSLLRNSSGQMHERFNMRSANCTTQLFDLIDSAVAPSKISPGLSPVFALPAARFYTDTLRQDAPWVSALITLALGSASDEPVAGARSVSPLIFDDQYRYFTIMPEGRPLVTHAVEIHRRTSSVSPPSVTPVDISIALAAILLISSLLAVAGIRPDIVSTLDRITFGFIFIFGALIAFATFTPYSVGSGFSWTLTVINPLVILLPALSRYPTAARILTSVWAAWLIIYTIFSPYFTAESLSAVRILAAALALRLLTLRHTNSALNLAG
ncbi:MAG: DUF4105 domain-containing protein [Duncaniella sp.]|nr:DUF4105 domain-containing protein [Duncaniella sp.]